MARSSIAVSLPLDTEPKLAPTTEGEGLVKQTSLHFDRTGLLSDCISIDPPELVMFSFCRGR